MRGENALAKSWREFGVVLWGWDTADIGLFDAVTLFPRGAFKARTFSIFERTDQEPRAQPVKG